MTMSEDIRKAISENLSQTIGEELRKRLDQADIDAGLVGNLNDQIKIFKEARKETDAIIQRHESRDKALREREDGASKREGEVAEREKAITTLELTSKYETEKREMAVHFVDKLLANRTAREQIMSTRDAVKRYDSQGFMREEVTPESNLDTKDTEEG